MPYYYRTKKTTSKYIKAMTYSYDLLNTVAYGTYGLNWQSCSNDQQELIVEFLDNRKCT